jgi:hypothetical protein
LNSETEKEEIGDLPPIHVVISYRREDTPGGAGRLRQDLGAHFGRENVFLDIDAIPPGVDWVEEIEKTVSSSDVLLPVIGLHWLTVTDENGHRRLDDPDDVLRFEIETALKTRVRVIPIQLHGAPMPKADELPASLVGLTRRQSVRIDDEDWPHDVQKLVRALERMRREKAEVLRAKAAEREAAERQPLEQKAAARSERERVERDAAERAERQRLEQLAAERERTGEPEVVRVEPRDAKEDGRTPETRFTDVWYRRPGSKTETGTLTVARGRLRFEGKNAVDITDIRGVSMRYHWTLESKWVTVDYGDGQRAMFADGRALGLAAVLGGTGTLYKAIQAAARN